MQIMFISVLPVLSDGRCTNTPTSEDDCGYGGINVEYCVVELDCCWDRTRSNAPWCFRDTNGE